jgi:phosphopantothenoylcysteine decarboxylase/phosphopantothenate--cysteine ligase
MKGAHILLGVTGSIAAFKAADLAARLTADGAEVAVIMTESAQRFVAPLTFETLARRPVITSLWDRTTEVEPAHVELADWSDLLVVAPASANFIGKLAHGIADDMLSCMAITVTRPPLIAPAMNDNMYRHPAVQENIRTLRRRGCTFVGPVKGRLASGKVALGRLSDLEDILAAIRRALKTGGRK